MRGKLIAFEGIDGVGKGTQLRLTQKALEIKGIPFKAAVFPRHGKPSAYFLDKYLSLDKPYGASEDLDPYRVSLFYALERYDASFEIKAWLQDGFHVIADRYTASNIGHQGGKIKSDEERRRYVEWLYDLEYRLLEIPKPDVNIILRLPYEIAYARIESRGKARDGHEVNQEHLKNAQMAYLWAAKRYPDEFKVVKCFDDERQLTEAQVQEKVWEAIQEKISAA